MFTKFKCLGAAAQPAFIFSTKEQRERSSEKSGEENVRKCIFKIRIGCCTLSLLLSVSVITSLDFLFVVFLCVFLIGIFSPGRSNDCLRLIGKRFVLLFCCVVFFSGGFYRLTSANANYANFD